MLDGYFISAFGPLRGTHDSVESHALRSLFPRERQALPRFSAIRAFSGPLGPDVLWLLGRYGAHRSRYDPFRRSGGAIEECRGLFRELRTKGTPVGRARAAGYLAHTVADLCDPAHHIGRPGRIRARAFGVLRAESWNDPLTGSLWDADERHNHFEWLLAGSRIIAPRDVVRGLIRERRTFFDHRLRTQSIGVILHEAALGIARTGLWERFLRGDAPDRLRGALARQVILPASGLIAALWGLALSRILGIGPEPDQEFTPTR